MLARRLTVATGDNISQWGVNVAAGTRDWSRIAISDNGQGLLAGTFTSSTPVYISYDKGASWITRLSLSAVWSLSVSGDFSKQLVGPGAGTAVNYLSIDSGGTFNTACSGSAGTWQGSAVSRDGKHMVAAKYSAGASHVFVSHDYGVTWADKTSASGGVSRYWTHAAISDDGQIMFLTNYSGYVTRSIDGGNTWASMINAGSSSWGQISCSGDGQKVIATSDADIAKLSLDGGTNWTTITIPNTNYKAPHVSGDGTKLFIVARGTAAGVYTSVDDGVSWQSRYLAAVSWRYITASHDGRFVAACDTSKIYC